MEVQCRGYSCCKDHGDPLRIRWHREVSAPINQTAVGLKEVIRRDLTNEERRGYGVLDEFLTTTQ